MQLVKTTIVTSLEEIQDLMRHIIVNELKGQINLTFEGEHIRVWQPSNEIMAESVVSVPRHPSIKVVHDREFCGDVFVDLNGTE